MVHVLERVQRLVGAPGSTEVLQRPVGDDLVDVHVGRRAGPTLDEVDDELVEQGAAADFLARGHDRVGQGGG